MERIVDSISKINLIELSIAAVVVCIIFMTIIYFIYKRL